MFKIGQFHVAKCWDIALVNMHAQESIKLKCPAFYAYGGTSRYGQFDHEIIPSNSELTFVLDVLECQPTIDKINDKNEAANNHAPRLSSAQVEEPDVADDEEATFKKQAKKDIKTAEEGLDEAAKKIKAQKATIAN